MALTTMRLLTSGRRVTCAALAKASATFAESPAWKSRQTLPGASSKTWGAPTAVAARASVTAGSGSMSTSTASAASFACARVSATTKATGSPTKRTLSVASEWRVGVFIGVPSRLGTMIMVFSAP